MKVVFPKAAKALAVVTNTRHLFDTPQCFKKQVEEQRAAKSKRYPLYVATTHKNGIRSQLENNLWLCMSRDLICLNQIIADNIPDIPEYRLFLFLKVGMDFVKFHQGSSGFSTENILVRFDGFLP